MAETTRGRPKKQRPESFALSDDERRSHQDAIGLRMREQRELRGWSTGDLAAATGLSADAIRKLERGEQAPMTTTILVLSKALRCGAGWLAFGG